MENPRKHDKKKNTKTLPLVMNISAGAGAGRFGIGGIVLLGGVLVTATIVSTLAFRRRSQRRSSSENMKTSMSPSPETESLDGPHKLEVIMKTNEDSPAYNSPLEAENPSDEVTNMKEIQDKNVQSLTPDEKRDYVHSGDIIVSVGGEDQENTPILVDSAFEREESAFGCEECDNICEKKDLNSVKQVVMAAQIEETVFMNEAAAETEGGCVHQPEVEVEDNLQVQFLEEVEKDGHDETFVKNYKGQLCDETGYVDQIGCEVVMEEEAFDTASLLQIEVMGEDEAAPEMHQVCETFVVAYVMNILKEAVDYQITEKEDTETAQEVEEQVTVEEGLFNEDDQLAKVDDQTDNPPTQLMNKEEETAESVKKDGIPHAQFVKEDEGSEEVTPEVKISNHKIEENMEENQAIIKEGEGSKLTSNDDEQQAFAAGEPWNLRLITWSVLITVWCLCHWYSELPFPELSLVGSLLFILILLGYQNRAGGFIGSSFSISQER